jgi:uncharacterized protein YndB with AHSA1/START domain
MTTATTPATQVYAMYIRATPEAIWEAITSPQFTARYFHGSEVESTFEPGASYTGWAPGRASKLVEGEVLESEPPRLLRHTWRALWDDTAAAEPQSRVTWEIEPQEDGTCRLTVTHDQLEESPATAAAVTGWTFVLSGLKTLLETGAPMTGPGAATA